MDDLNHPKVRKFTREIGRRLRIDESFLDFVFADKRPDCFQYWVEDVASGWTCYVPDEFDVTYPLWSTNANQTLLLVTGDSLVFGQGYHDSPEVNLIAKTTQGLLTELMIQLIESEASDVELREAAEFCGYRFFDRLLILMDTISSEDYSVLIGHFITEVDETSI
ncbi:MAG: hypothetical protein R3C11_06545 [Planctomycetaceae bacterium]